MKRAFRFAAAILTAADIFIFSLCASLSPRLPDEVTAYRGETVSFNHFITIRTNNQSKCPCLKEDTVQVNRQIGSTSRHESGELTLCNIIPIKGVTVHQAEKKYVVPSGELFGIKFYARGVIVVECCDVRSGSKTVNPAHSGGIDVGDIILEADGKIITRCADLEEAVRKSEGRSISLLVLRGSKRFRAAITPAQTSSGYQLGFWIKDSAAGLGTMTFYDESTNRFASLGHGICDDETGQLLTLDSAEITQVEIAGITKGVDGSPGSLNGYFSEKPALGYADRNSEMGLFGTLEYSPHGGEPVEVAGIYEVRKGKAQILCTLDGGTPELYDIEITKVDYDEKNKTKNLQITATDERLIEKTGGIIQGMSGSPILQNGKLVGAVTHVLITNSAKGYGIFAQNMVDEMDKAQF